MGSDSAAGPVLVFAPHPVLTVTVEQRGEEPDIHVHAGGQGVWQARMLAALEVPVALCGCFGGEPGRVLRHLLADEGFGLHAVTGVSRNGAYVHDRRDGERQEVVRAAGDPLTRHELDELYQLALTEALEAGTCLLSGVFDPVLVPAQMYCRLARDLSGNGCRVIADLSGEYLDAVLEGGLYLVKVSHQELLTDHRAESEAVPDLLAAARDLLHRGTEVGGGAEVVLVTRQSAPALVAHGEQVWELVVPTLEPADPHGAGDALTAGVTAGLVRGQSLVDAVRLGGAAGVVNVARHGLGTGSRQAVQMLIRRVELRPLQEVR
jgi:1-phosphofructokinase